jgi:hypothetical protein
MNDMFLRVLIALDYEKIKFLLLLIHHLIVFDIIYISTTQNGERSRRRNNEQISKSNRIGERANFIYSLFGISDPKQCTSLQQEKRKFV